MQIGDYRRFTVVPNLTKTEPTVWLGSDGVFILANNPPFLIIRSEKGSAKEGDLERKSDPSIEGPI